MRIAHPSVRFLISLTHNQNVSSSPNKSVLSFSYKPHRNTLKLPSKLKITASMADSTSENIAKLISSEEDDAKFGFGRPEMFKEKLAGTVDQYDRHVFLCFNSPDAWLPRVEQSEVDPLPKLLSSAIKARKNDITLKTKVTICEGGEGTQFENGDVLIFPDMIKYKGLKETDVDGFVDDVLVNGRPWASGELEVLTGSHIFVCAHGSRDKRCGVCGPVLIEKLKEGIESRGLTGEISVSACSHIGGHKYAGNLIVYSPDSGGNILGNWYGYVTPADVDEVLDQQIAKGEVIERIWRGKMGPATKGDVVAAKEVLPNGNEVKESKKVEESNAAEISKENAGGCCQGINGFSCCQNVNEDKNLKENSEVHEKKDQGKLSCWVSSLERGDVLAGVAVVGAVATIAVAYSLYKRSG